MYRFIYIILFLFCSGGKSIDILKDKPQSNIQIDLPTENLTISTSSLSPNSFDDNDKEESPLVYQHTLDDSNKIPEMNIPNLPCHLNDNKCIADALNSFVRLYPNGNPLIKLPSIEPFYVTKFDVIDERNDANGNGYRARIISKDLKSDGFGNSTFSVKGFQSDIDSSNVTINIFIAKLLCQADYDIIMKFHERKIYGKGHFLWNFEDFDFILNFQPKIRKNLVNGKHFLNLDNFNLEFIARKVILNFDNLFDGDTEASEREHKYLNEHIPEFFDELRYAASSAWKSVFLHLLTPIFEYNSIDGIFLL